MAELFAGDVIGRASPISRNPSVSIPYEAVFGIQITESRIRRLHLPSTFILRQPPEIETAWRGGVGGQGLGIDLPKIFALLLATGRHRRCNYPLRATTRWNPATSPLRVSAILRGISALLCYFHADTLLAHSSSHLVWSRYTTAWNVLFLYEWEMFESVLVGEIFLNFIGDVAEFKDSGEVAFPFWNSTGIYFNRCLFFPFSVGGFWAMFKGSLATTIFVTKYSLGGLC